MTAAGAIAVSRDVVLLAALAVSVYTDVTRGKVYDWCTLTALLLGLLIGLVAGADGRAQANWLAESLGEPLIDALLGVGLALGIFGIAHLMGMVGGGDVKLMCAIGALKGWRFCFDAIFLTACAGAIVAFAVLIWRGRLKEGLKRSTLALVAPWKLRRRAAAVPAGAAELTRIPYATAIAAGTLAAWVLRAA